jgi:hypothetical protein
MSLEAELGSILHYYRMRVKVLFHTKMEVLQRQAYGFRNFQN